MRVTAVRSARGELLLLLPLLGCHAARSGEEAKAAIMRADVDFAQATAQRGLDGWVEWFAVDGIQVPSHGEIVSGLPAIREYMTSTFADTSVHLTWKPDWAEVASNGDLGYTFGHWRVLKDHMTVVSSGRYLTVWRRQPDGKWKVAADIGNEAPPPTTP